jgi:hypothetical protein
MANLVTLVVFVLIPPTVWWLYGPQQLASAVGTGFRFFVPVMVGALGGVVAGLVSTASGAPTNILVGIAVGTTALSGIPLAHWLRTRKGQELGAPEEVPVPKTEVDYLWIPPLERRFHCAHCSYRTDEADRPWSILRTTRACPRCGKPAFPGFSSAATTFAKKRATSRPRSKGSLERLSRVRDSEDLTEREDLESLLDMLDHSAR